MHTYIHYSLSRALSHARSLTRILRTCCQFHAPGRVKPRALIGRGTRRLLTIPALRLLEEALETVCPISRFSQRARLRTLPSAVEQHASKWITKRMWFLLQAARRRCGRKVFLLLRRRRRRWRQRWWWRRRRCVVRGSAKRIEIVKAYCCPCRRSGRRVHEATRRRTCRLRCQSQERIALRVMSRDCCCWCGRNCLCVSCHWRGRRGRRRRRRRRSGGRCRLSCRGIGSQEVAEGVIVERILLKCHFSRWRRRCVYA